MHSETCDTVANISGGDALKILDIIKRSLACGSKNDFKNLFVKIRELFAFDFAGVECGFYDTQRGTVVTGGLNISFPKEWTHEYFSKNYHRESALTKENFKTYQPQYIVNTWNKYQQKAEIVSLCLDFNIRSGYAYGAQPSAPGQKGSMFVFAGMDINNDRRTAAILEMVVPHLHQAYYRIDAGKKFKYHKPILTVREKEILEWLKLGKSSWDISIILSISQNTVNFHIYNILRKLKAVNRPQAIAIAIHMGIISPV
jgi:DNA-binding CsgD family transcriptional regulator